MENISSLQSVVPTVGTTFVEDSVHMLTRSHASEFYCEKNMVQEFLGYDLRKKNVVYGERKIT